MAEIKLSELRPAGSELLEDSESFLNELNDRELENVAGGSIGTFVSQNPISRGTINTISLVSYSVGVLTILEECH